MITSLTTLLLLVTWALHIASKWAVGDNWLLNWVTVSQLFSLWGTVMLCWSFGLSSRARFLENILGGQDKIIKGHQKIGVLAFFLILHHPIFLAVNALPNFSLATKYIYFSSDFTYNLGVLGLYTMISMLALTLVVNLPYELWLKTHDLLGATLWFGGAHIFFIESDVSRYLPLRVWIFVMLFGGLYAFVYKAFLYRWFGPRYKYSVDRAEQKGDVIEIWLQPAGSDKLKFEPGQFIYVEFGGDMRGERHPFSISSAPGEERLRLSVKILGDYTLKLKKIAIGTQAIIWGPYGKMGSGFDRDNKIVMVAGGIGITPFLSMIRSEALKPRDRQLFLFYSAKNKVEMVYEEEVLEATSKLTNFKLIGRTSDVYTRLTGEEIMEQVNGGEKSRFYLCGPRKMMEDIYRQLAKLGVKRRNIIFEDFAFKV